MSDLIDIKAYPVKELLSVLLMDKSTKKNIIWATVIQGLYAPFIEEWNALIYHYGYGS